MGGGPAELAAQRAPVAVAESPLLATALRF